MPDLLDVNAIEETVIDTAVLAAIAAHDGDAFLLLPYFSTDSSQVVDRFA